jgi:prepilin-type N-terminal cleavage/methylation domain-containing protein
MRDISTQEAQGMRSHRSRGFSLVEVVIALSILSFALFGAISVITYTTRMNTSTRERTLAMRAAERKIEKMLSCGNFSEIYAQFKDQAEGVGWEAVEGLEPIDPPPLPPPTDAGSYTYPTWTNKSLPPPVRPVLFVRFPLSADGTSFSEGKDLPAYPGSGIFTDSYVVDAKGRRVPDKNGKPQPVDFDFNGNGSWSDKILTSDILTLKLLPVSIEVYWKGIAGNTSLKYRYIFFKDPLK